MEQKYKGPRVQAPDPTEEEQWDFAESIFRGEMREKVRKMRQEQEEERERLAYLMGTISLEEIQDPEIKAWATAREVEKEKKEREHLLIMLGYNQAMLDWAKFPIRNPQDPNDLRTREQQEQIIQDIKQRLNN